MEASETLMLVRFGRVFERRRRGLRMRNRLVAALERASKLTSGFVADTRHQRDEGQDHQQRKPALIPHVYSRPLREATAQGRPGL